jgi:hypothetical protein
MDEPEKDDVNGFKNTVFVEIKSTDRSQKPSPTPAKNHTISGS